MCSLVLLKANTYCHFLCQRSNSRLSDWNSLQCTCASRCTCSSVSLCTCIDSLVLIYASNWCDALMRTVRDCVCIGQTAPPAIYSVQGHVYCALSKCQHCQSSPPISLSLCCWALLVFISADRWIPRLTLTLTTHKHTHKHKHPKNSPFICAPVNFLVLYFFSVLAFANKLCSPFFRGEKPSPRSS